MGFWDVVKSVALSAKCATGWHAGDWQKTAGGPECSMGKTCPDCHTYVTTNKHSYTEWKKINYSNCNSVRECKHCGSTEEKIVHEYENNGKDDNCRLISKCRDCGSIETGREDHEWVKFLDHEVKVGGKRKCRRCGTTG